MILPQCKANSLNDLILSLEFSLYCFEFSEILSKLQQPLPMRYCYAYKY